MLNKRVKFVALTDLIRLQIRLNCIAKKQVKWNMTKRERIYIALKKRI